MWITRKEFEARIALVEKALEKKYEARIRDLERQFATKYDDAGKVVETLADIPMDQRANVKVIRKPRNPMAGMTWQQQKNYLEATDGGRKVGNVQR
jgi:hypothetical protein